MYVYIGILEQFDTKIIHEDLIQFKIFVNRDNFICQIFALKIFQYHQIKIGTSGKNVLIPSNCILC